MTLLYIEGFEGFTTGGDRTALDHAYDFDDLTSASDAGVSSGRITGKAAFIAEGNVASAPMRLPVAGLSSQDDWIVGVAFKVTYNYYRTANVTPPLIRFLNSNDATILGIYPGGGTIAAINGANTNLGIADTSITTTVWHYLEAKVNFHASTGSVTLRLNGEEILALTNVNTLGSQTQTRPSTIQFGSSGDKVRCDIDDIYICDDQGSVHNDFLGDRVVRRLSPSGAGTAAGFDTSAVADNYTLVDEDDPDGDTTYVESNTATTKDTYAFGDISDDPALIEAIAAKSYVTKTDGGDRTFVHVARSNGTEEDSAALYPSAGSYRHMQSVFPHDPDTSDLWLKAAVNAAEFGFKVDS